MSVNAWAAKVSFGADVNSKNKQSVLLALEGTVADASYAPFLREVKGRKGPLGRKVV